MTNELICEEVPPGTEAQLDSNAVQKVVHLIRHGQGTHNLYAISVSHKEGKKCLCTLGQPGCPYTNDAHFDAELTLRGRKQASAAGATLLQTRPIPECVFVSPLRRTLQTATIALSSCPDLKVPVIAEEIIRERNGVHPCDKRSAREDVEDLFPTVDFGNIESGPDALFSEIRESEDDLAARGKKFFLSLRDRPETSFAVFTHSSFLFNTMTRSFKSPVANDARRFQTGESRVVVLTYT